MMRTAIADAGMSTIWPTPERALAIIPKTPPMSMYGNPNSNVMSAEPKIWKESPGSMPAFNCHNKAKKIRLEA